MIILVYLKIYKYNTDIMEKISVISLFSDYTNFSKLLIHNFKSLPKTHDEISLDNFKFQIKISDQRRIHSIQVEVKE